MTAMESNHSNSRDLREATKEAFRKWLKDLFSSLKSIPKRRDNPPPPKHPTESMN